MKHQVGCNVGNLKGGEWVIWLCQVANVGATPPECWEQPSEWIFMSTATVIQPATMGLSPPEVWIFGKSSAGP